MQISIANFCGGTLRRALVAVIAFTTLAVPGAGTVQAQTTTPLNCSAAYQIVRTMTNRAKWEMCWEPRAGYGYRLNQVTFTPAGGVRRLILASMHVAQLFVPYDDGGPRYRDLSYGQNLAMLSTAECPNGTLLTNSTLCLTQKSRGLTHISILDDARGEGESLDVKGYFSVGNYFYVVQYVFHDDGAIEPLVGASGALQRFGGTTATGWPVKTQIAINHNHLAIWRLDFDLDGAANDLVEQIDFASGSNDTRSMQITRLGTETRAQNNPEQARFWRVRDTVKTNADGHATSYEIEPALYESYRAGESFTQNDFYVTNGRTTEILVDDGNGLDSFVNGETVNDVVIWYGVNFHHVPRDEDDVRMPAHFQGFTIRPRDLQAGENPPATTPTPTPVPVASRTPNPPTATAAPTAIVPTPTPLVPTATPQRLCATDNVGWFTIVSFNNTLAQPVNVYQVSTTCSESFMGTLQPGQSYSLWVNGGNTFAMRNPQSGALIKSVSIAGSSTIQIP